MGVEGVVAFGMIHAKFASLTSFSTEETVLLSAPPQTPLFGWKRGQNVFEERNFQNFLPGLYDNRGEGGRNGYCCWCRR